MLNTKQRRRRGGDGGRGRSQGDHAWHAVSLYNGRVEERILVETHTRGRIASQDVSRDVTNNRAELGADLAEVDVDEGGGRMRGRS